MRFRAPRVLPMLAFLVALATTVEAAPVTPAPGPVTLAAKTTVAPAATRRRRARRRLPPDGVFSRNAILLDPATGEVLFEKNSSRSVPIASITKLMTAMVFLEQQPDLGREVVVTLVDIRGAGQTQLRNNEVVSLGELLHMSLMSSDNCATRVLARESGLPHADFISRMNRKAVELGLTGTHFDEVTGLDERNVSSASDVARMLHAAAHEPLIAEITTMRSYQFRTTRRYHMVGNTNRLLYGRYEVKGGKTGFIREAGYCFATWVRSQGRDLIAVVLGAPTNATRFADTVRMLQKVQQPTVTNTQP